MRFSLRADGVYSDKSGCTQWHSKGVYQIPYRSLYSRNISNLFLAGRDIVSHVAFGSTRVMATCAHTAQAVGLAAVICVERGCPPVICWLPPSLTNFKLGFWPRATTFRILFSRTLPTLRLRRGLTQRAPSSWAS
jgi:hypothetical protein